MINNEETRIINPNENGNEVIESVGTNPQSETSKREWGKYAASVGAAFVGGAAGATAAEYAQAEFGNQDSEESSENVETQTDNTSHVAAAQATVTPTVEEAKTEETIETIETIEEPDAFPSNTTLVSNPSPDELQQPETEDGEVRVVGIEAVQNEDGSQAIIAGLELDGDQALVVDVNSDGTLNLFIHDDNYDGQISEDEVHDITAENLSTQALIDSAIQQEVNQELYYTSDEMPDYMNNADTGLVEV